jgi:hypothetical protein
MLPLDDPRWEDLNHRGWTAGHRYSLEPDAPFVPKELAALLDDPADIERFSALWPYLCSEGTTWAAAYAAVPYVVELASRLPAGQRFEHLYFVGLVVMCSCPEAGESFVIKPYLRESYQVALGQALPLLAETLASSPLDELHTRYLLAATAALKGHPRLGTALNEIHRSTACPSCGTEVRIWD